MTQQKKEFKPSSDFAGATLDEMGNSFTGFGSNRTRPELLLHSCCGPCSTSVIERLAPDYRITVFYFNPCITDREEYERRKENQKAFIDAFNRESESQEKIKFIEGAYDPASYFEKVKGLEEEPEGGTRCKVCFRQRLEETAKKAKAMGFEFFTTTLSVSPHKNFDVICAIGKELAEEYKVDFLDMDFKKKAGYQRSVQLAKKHGLYRQDYCGCQFSKRER